MKHANEEPQAVLDETVRRRLAALLDDVPARRAAPVEPALPPVPDRGLVRCEPRAPAAPDDDTPPAAGRGGAAARRAWAFGRQHATLVGVILLGACLWAGYTAAQARSTEVPASPEVSVTAAATVTPSSSPTPDMTPAQIQVHVIGGVKNPGVVDVPEGARVGDVLQAAGGLAKNGDPGELNLAAPAVDGSQIVVGTKAKPRGEVRVGGEAAGAPGAGSPGSSNASASGTISLNTATAAQLETLPGVGPVTAAKIIAWREAHGKFTNVTELQEVPGIGPKTYAEIAPHVRV